MKRTEDDQAERGLQVMRELCRELAALRVDLRDATEEAHGLRADLQAVVAKVAKLAATGQAVGVLGKLFGR